jgi:hypothetical protein
MVLASSVVYDNIDAMYYNTNHTLFILCFVLLKGHNRRRSLHRRSSVRLRIIQQQFHISHVQVKSVSNVATIKSVYDSTCYWVWPGRKEIVLINQQPTMCNSNNNHMRQMVQLIRAVGAWWMEEGEREEIGRDVRLSSFHSSSWHNLTTHRNSTQQ